jgi:hypothetical protein
MPRVAFQLANESGPSMWLAITVHRKIPMLDILMLALAAGLFAAGIGYAYVCERL